MTYAPRHSIIGVEIDGCEFTTDTEFLPWVHKQTDEGTERYQPCVVHGVKINGAWFDACAMGDDFIEEMEYEIQRMPLNADGDIDEAAIRMGKAVMAKRAAEAAQPEPATNAMQQLTAALQADPDYAWSWHCNLAMPVMDATGVTHRVANEAGARLMRHLFDIDITKHPHWNVCSDPAPALQPEPAAVPGWDERGRTNAGDETGGTVKRFGFDLSGAKPEITPATNGAFVYYSDYLALHKRLATPQPAPAGVVEALREMEARKDAAYLERNQVVAALAKCFPSGVARTAIEGWSEDWHGCVYIDLPTGQASWHFHDSQAYLFADLPPYTGKWDGHDTPEKYRRLAALSAPVRAAPLTDEQIEADFQRAGGRWDGDRWLIEDADLHPYVHGITGDKQHGR